MGGLRKVRSLRLARQLGGLVRCTPLRIQRLSGILRVQGLAAKSVRITSSAQNDAQWAQNGCRAAEYRVSAIGLGENRQCSTLDRANRRGCETSRSPVPGTHSRGVFGTSDWTYVSLIFTSGADTSVTITTRLGYWSGTTTGSAWFDDIQLVPTSAISNPRWNILVLIYTATDFSYTDAGGAPHNALATMTEAEKQRTANAATRFVDTDIPALTSGTMIPRLTIRYPDHPLTQLSAFCGFWPDPSATAADRDPSFDSVIVVWDDTGTDQATGQPADLQNCGGLTLPMGVDQTYSTFPIDSVHDTDRNVFKHEWGHAILDYYDAAGVAPKPAIDNHQPNVDVHCSTGQSYVLVDETDDMRCRILSTTTHQASRTTIIRGQPQHPISRCVALASHQAPGLRAGRSQNPLC